MQSFSFVHTGRTFSLLDKLFKETYIHILYSLNHFYVVLHSFLVYKYIFIFMTIPFFHKPLG